MENRLLEWPYPIRYEVENEDTADVLVLGGGVAGCFAAISAAQRGAKVIIVDKGPIMTSGSGGAGVDHWNFPCTAPFCKISPDELTTVIKTETGGWDSGVTRYIQCRESYDALLDAESWGLPLRDKEDEFKDAPFRDEASKIMFAYDYENKHIVRVRGGAKIKYYYHKALKDHNVKMYERVMVTSLLTENGKQGRRVVGATGVNSRTGEFYVFRAKATILSMSVPKSPWMFSTELMGAASNISDPNCTGEGFSIAWDAGAEFTLLERSMPYPGHFNSVWLGVGYPGQTWYAASIVDANGKEIPWMDGRMNESISMDQRYRPAEGQKFTWAGLPIMPTRMTPKYLPPMLTLKLTNMIMEGELELPFYADLTSMPEHERRAIFGLMVGNEGRTRVPVYENYSQAGFDPAKDMLQSPVLPPKNYVFPAWIFGSPPEQYRTMGLTGGGLLYDWDLKTNLEGLWVAGQNGFAGLDHSSAATSGRYCGRKAVEYASQAPDAVIHAPQVKEEKARVYAPVKRKDGIGWKELTAGICHIMQEYCGYYKHKNTLELGLLWLRDIRESEGATAYARNPHELVRTLECFTNITVGEMIIEASLARRETNKELGLKRLDFPKKDKALAHKYLTIRMEDGQAKVRDLDHDYALKPPYSSTYEENYQRYSGL